MVQENKQSIKQEFGKPSGLSAPNHPRPSAIQNIQPNYKQYHLVWETGHQTIQNVALTTFLQRVQVK
jgi:hypothetical protein